MNRYFNDMKRPCVEKSKANLDKKMLSYPVMVHEELVNMRDSSLIRLQGM